MIRVNPESASPSSAVSFFVLISDGAPILAGSLIVRDVGALHTTATKLISLISLIEN